LKSQNSARSIGGLCLAVPLIGKLFFQKELHIFDSSKVGMIALNKNINTPVTTSLKTTNSNNNVGNIANAISYLRYNDIIGKKYFELSNHLGNVLVTVSDRKTPQFKTTGNAPNTVTTFSYFKASILSATDYYPFGMAMPGRKFDNDKYRYGFNGQEKTPEIFEGSTTALFWEYDSRTGRRWNVDPVVKVWESPYVTFGGNPATYADPLGDDWYKKDLGNGTHNFVWYKGSKKREGLEHIGKSHRYISCEKNIVTLHSNGTWTQESPRNDFEKAIANDKYVYTQNYGWVDKTHANDNGTFANVGVKSLWNQVLNETGEKSANGGFKVTFSQHMRYLGGFFTPGVTGSYHVKSRLDIETKRQIAFSILYHTSWNFEALQGAAGFMSNSSFEVSDMPSNALGLFKVMFNLSDNEVDKMIKPLTALESIDVFRANPNTTSMKNYTMKPVLFPNKYSPNTAAIPAMFGRFSIITPTGRKEDKLSIWFSPASTIDPTPWQKDAIPKYHF
jgi:hypothetical protein